MRRFTIVVFTVAVMLAVTAQAQVLIDPSHQCGVGQIEAGAGLLFSTVEYEFDDAVVIVDDWGIISTSISGDVEVDRTILGGYGAYGVGDGLDVFGALGLIVKSEDEHSNDDTSGFILACGARAQVMEVGSCDVMAYGQLSYLSEESGDSTLIELTCGALAVCPLSEQLNVYGGIDIVPFTNADVDGMSDSMDLERSSLFGLRCGGNLDLGGFWVRGELALVTETAILFSAGIAL